MKTILVLLFACMLAFSQAGLIDRQKRGYLSRTGFCPDPATNNRKKDARLNYWGMAVILADENGNPSCDESECEEDSHCDGANKCCKNNCGAKICTPAIRDPDPCSNVKCPSGETCKVQKVKCVMPECQDATAINRPTCVAAKAADIVPPPLPFSGPPPPAPPMLAYADPNLAGAEAPSADVQQQYSSPVPYDANGAAVASPQAVEQQYASPVQSEAMYPQSSPEGQTTATVASY